MTEFVDWLRGLAAKGGKGVVNNIDARCLGRIADTLETLTREKSALETANATFRKDTAETENRIIDAEFAAQEMKCRAEAAESALREALQEIIRTADDLSMGSRAAVLIEKIEGIIGPARADDILPAATSEDK